MNSSKVGSGVNSEVDTITLEIVERYKAEHPELSGDELYELIESENSEDGLPPIWRGEAFQSLELEYREYDGTPIEACPECGGEVACEEECERSNWHHPKRCECDQSVPEYVGEYLEYYRNCADSNTSAWHDGDTKWTGMSFKPLREKGDDADERDPEYLGGHTFRDHGLTQLIRAASEVNGVPEPLCAMMALFTMSSGIGNGLKVSFKPNEVTSLNIYAIGIARSGTCKTLTGKIFSAPLVDLHSQMRKEFEQNVRPGLIAKKKVKEMRLKELMVACSKKYSDDLLEQITEVEAELTKLDACMETQHLYLEDVTVERLVSLLPLTGEQMSFYSADAGAAIQNILGKYNKDGRTDDTIFVKGYSVEPYSQARLSRADVNLEHPCFSLCWLIQPDKWASLIGSGALKDGGFLPRALLANFEVEPQFDDGESRCIPPPRIAHYTERFLELFHAYRDPIANGAEPKILSVSHEGAEMMREFSNEICAQRRKGKENDEFTARWVENAKKIAGVLHAQYFGGRSHEQPVSAVTVLYAIKAIRWFMRRQESLLHEETPEGKSVSQWPKFVEAFEKGNREPMNLRDVKRNLNIDESTVQGWVEALKAPMGFVRYKITKLRNPNGTFTTYFHSIFKRPKSLHGDS